MELWNKKYPDFIGYNCRITAFDLMKDKISVKAEAKVNASNLFMDQDALKNENELFIGHAGVLVPTKDKKLLFVEKLSFSLPYQVLKFDNRKQLKNYLMGMYDISWGQEEAKPFIMENTKTAL